jgi:hypothetical protein
MNRGAIIYLTAFCFCGQGLAQEDKPVQDSTVIIKDSLIYNSIDRSSEQSIRDSSKYREIEKFSERSKFTGFLHRFLFRPMTPDRSSLFPGIDKVNSEMHARGQGKIIRKIEIITLDPFGYSINDTSSYPDKFVMRVGNTIHAKTNSPVIRNLLMFRQGEGYDSLLVDESKRLIRRQQYIRDIRLNVVSAGRDSVDVYLRVMDVWSLIPAARRTGTEFGFGLTDLNFAGTGSSLEVSTLWKNNGGGNITNLSYLIPNIRNTYTSFNIQYQFSPTGKLTDVVDFESYFYSPVSYNPQYMFSDNQNIIRSIELNRPFYSPLAKWGGGIFAGQMITTQSYLKFDTIRYLSSSTNIQDFWIGRSWHLNKESPSRVWITSLVLSGRLVRTATPDRTGEAWAANIFQTRTYYFGGLSLTSRKYVRDRYIFNYGKTEDVPAGRMAGITIGREYHQKNRTYFSVNAGMGNYFPFGYLSTHLSYGTFLGGVGFQQGMLTGRLTYFTRLLSLGNWRLRQFVRPSFAYGINRSPADNQPLKIGIRGFEALESNASNISVISLQTQSYAPWNLAGFHFGPFFFSQFGILGEEPFGIREKRYYSLLGLGMLIKNDYLMFSTFQLSFSFYPFIPGSGYDIIRTNAYKTTDYGFRDFEVSKPGIVE